MKVTGTDPGAPCWTQLSVADVQAAKDFYGQLFGWTAQTDPDPQFGGYTMFSLNGAPCAAVAPLMNPQQPVQWLTSFATDDIAAGAAAAAKAGARVWSEPMDVAALGRWALLSDPTGAAFALWQKNTFAGFAVVDEPNAFGWADLATRDVKTAVAFYQDVFGWQVQPDDDYPMFGLGERMFAGAMQMDDRYPPQVPSHWSPFFQVADVDSTAAAAARLGAAVVHGPVDTEMEGGPRVAALRDPQGATFGIFAPIG